MATQVDNSVIFTCMTCWKSSFDYGKFTASATPDLTWLGETFVVSIAFSDKKQPVYYEFTMVIVETNADLTDYCAEEEVAVFEQEVVKEVEVEVEVFDFGDFIGEFGWFFSAGFIFEQDSREFKKIMKILEEVPFPLPIVIDFSAQGVLEILMTKPLLVPTKSDMVEFIEEFHKDNYIKLTLIENEGHTRINGVPKFEAEHFEEKEEEGESEVEGKSNGRRLQSEEELLNKEESMMFELDDFIRSGEIFFNWTVISYNSNRIFIQLDFSHPEFISYGLIDKLDVEYMEP